MKKTNLINCLIITVLIASTMLLTGCKKDKPPVPVAIFTFSGENIPAPCEVLFTNSSTNALSYDWEFGDGATSTEQSTKHIYTSGGTYIIKLTATGEGGTNSISKEITIKSPVPVANFTFAGDNNDAPCEVSFLNSSTNATSFVWEFGDGTTSTEKDTKHTFTTGGIFTVKLTATGEGGSNSTSKDVTIKFPAPVADFTYTGGNFIAPCTVIFANVSTNATSFQWEFGDGEVSTLSNPTHTYINGGNFVVRLIATGDGGNTSISKEITIISLIPVADFTYSGGNCTAPCSVNFTNFSSNATSFLWEFGDGVVSTFDNPTHTYTYGGTFAVKLTADGYGSSSSITKYVEIENPDLYTDVTFNNPVFTDIYITFNNSTQIISPGSSVTFYAVPNGYESLWAYTMGTTTSGTQIGVKIEWEHTVELLGGSSTFILIITSNHFFMYMKNYGTHDLTPLYVNYGLSSETVDNILIPNDNVLYRIGYYETWTNTEVRAYYQDMPSYYTYWYNIDFPWTDNQYIELNNSYNGASGIDEEPKSFANPSQLQPSIKNPVINPNFDKSSIKLYCK
jgi:PKD repeat protein